jgi:TrmH family RNA methyltransferase
MVSKNDIKFLNSLKQKKFRYLNKCFVVEGKKSIREFLDSNFKLLKLYSVNFSFFKNINNHFKIDRKDLKKMSFLNNPDDHIAIFRIKTPKPIEKNNLKIALESIRDPGNFGSIIRSCEWFGIKDVICSLDCVDCYNPKVIQSAMGSISRINVTYLNLKNYLKSFDGVTMGTALEGKSIYNLVEPNKKVIIVFGNEANGISKEILKITNCNLTIPKFSDNDFPESLNITSSLNIILSEIRRKKLYFNENLNL